MKGLKSMDTGLRAGGKTVLGGMVKIAYVFIFLLMGVQILLGTVWMCRNFFYVQAFAETSELLEVSRTWVLDEYIGIGYPAVLALVQGLERLTGISYTFFLYVLQTAAAYGAAVYFLKKIGTGNKIGGKMGRLAAYYGGAYILTVPMLMQLHLSVLPFSFAFSACMLLLGEGIGALRMKTPPRLRSLAVICGMWLLASVFVTDNIWLCGTVTFFIFAGLLWKHKKSYLHLLLAFFVAAAAVFGTACLTRQPGSRGRIQKTVSAAMLSRFVWPNFARNRYFWNIYVTDVFDDSALLEISLEPENVITVFGPAMDRAYGREMAASVYRQMAKVSWEVRTKDVVYEIAADAAAYFCPQISVQYHLSGKGVSYSGWNYSRMQEHTPALSGFYVDYSLKCWNAAAVLSLLLLFLQKALKIRRKGRKALGPAHKGTALTVLLTVAVWTFWYTMSGSGMQDYRNVLPVTALWTVFILIGWEAGAADDEKA